MATQKSIYISHAWGGISDEILAQLVPKLEAENIAFILDKRDLAYKGSIHDFMVKLGKADMVIIILSNKYLKSEYCMFELIQIYRNQNLNERIFPIVLDEVKISSSSDRLEFVKYWEGQLMDLQNKVKELNSLSYIEGITEDLNLYSEIRNNIARLTGILRDLNTLNIALHQESDYHDLITAIKKRMDEEPPVEASGVVEDKKVAPVVAQPDQPAKGSTIGKRILGVPVMVRNMVIVGLALFGLFMLWGILSKSNILANNNGVESEQQHSPDTFKQQPSTANNDQINNSLKGVEPSFSKENQTVFQNPTSSSTKKTTPSQTYTVPDKPKQEVSSPGSEPVVKKEEEPSKITSENKTTPIVNNPPAESPKEVVLNHSFLLPKGTTITARNNLAFSSDDPNAIPRKINFVLDQPLYNGSQIVVPSGSLITASIVKVRKSEYRRTGTMDIIFEQLAAPDNQSIPLVGNEMHLEAKGTTPYEIKANTTLRLKTTISTTIRY